MVRPRRELIESVGAAAGTDLGSSRGTTVYPRRAGAAPPPGRALRCGRTVDGGAAAAPDLRQILADRRASSGHGAWAVAWRLAAGPRGNGATRGAGGGRRASGGLGAG